MKKFGILRLNTSPYFSPDFLMNEKLSLENQTGITYLSNKEVKDFSEVILISNTHSDLSELGESILEKTKLIIHSNSGYDNLIKDYDLIEKIPTLIGHEIRAQAVADYILAALIDGTSSIPHVHFWDSSRKWPRKLISELRVALFGFGHIGKIVFQTLKSLNLNITIFDPYKENCQVFKEDTDLSHFDLIISSMSLNERNHHFFNSVFFKKLNSDVIFINAARGKLVEEKSLIEFLINNPNAKAYLDVFEKEPFTDKWNLISNAFKSSHIAGVYGNIDQNTILFETRVVQDFFSYGLDKFLEKYHTQLLQSKIYQGIFI